MVAPRALVFRPLVEGNEDSGNEDSGNEIVADSFVRATNNDILVPKGRAPFGRHQESRPLGRSNFLSMRRVIVSYSQPIRFVRHDSEHAQSNGKSVNCGLTVSDLPRGHDSWC